MNSEGFIKLSRGFFRHPFWTKPRVYSEAEAWLDLIQRAAWRPRREFVNGRFHVVPRGAMIGSVRFLVDKWKWSSATVQRFLAMLESEQMVTRELKQGITLITLCNFDTFNSPGAPDETVIDTEDETPNSTATSTATSTAIDTILEEGKEVQEGHTLVPARATPTLESVKAAAGKMGVEDHVAETWWHDCEARPLSPAGKYTGKDGHEIRNWQSALKAFANRWQARDAEAKARHPGRRTEADRDFERTGIRSTAGSTIKRL